MAAKFGADELNEYFEALSAELSAASVTAELFVVGGAAMALEFDRSRTTRDVDAVFAPTQNVREAALRVAERFDIARDWLNDGVKGFLLEETGERTTVFESESLLVQVPPARYLLAMKIHASRDDVDRADAVKLFKLAGLRSGDEAVELLQDFYPVQQLLPRHRYMAHEIAQEALGFESKPALGTEVIPPPAKPMDERGRSGPSHEIGL